MALDGPAIGPMVSETQRQIVHKQVVAATSAGAKVLLGGALPPKSQKGTFYPPTVLGSVPHDAKAITQEETFGPVVALSTFDGVVLYKKKITKGKCRPLETMPRHEYGEQTCFQRR